ncbi:MAG: aminopeptidase P family protein [Aureliella sp.]
MHHTATHFKKRRQKLRKGHSSSALSLRKGSALLVTNENNVRYLTGFTGDSSYLIIDASGDTLISDPRYEEQIAQQCPGLDCHIRLPSERLLDVSAELLRRRGYGTVFVEGDHLSVTAYRHLEQAGLPLEASSGEVERLRQIKDAGEIAILRRAVRIAEDVFTSIRAQLTSQMSEIDVANELERQIRNLGGSGCSFDPIVAGGPRAALPHATPTEAKIGDSPLLLIDWGATFSGYRSDLTRVLLTSKIPAKIVKAYEAVLAAQQAAIAAMKPGVKVREIDAVAREVIADAKMAKQFNHGLGHGIGLDIHESPLMGSSYDDTLAAGMVVTVEPGIYFPNLGGIRIEDDVLITADGCERLSTLPRDRAANTVDLIF